MFLCFPVAWLSPACCDCGAGGGGWCWKLGRGPLPTQHGAPDAPSLTSPGLTSAFRSIFMYVPKVKLFNNCSQEAAQIVQREPMSPPAGFSQGSTVWVYVPTQHCEPPSVVTPAVPDPVPHLWRRVVSSVLKRGMAEFGGFLPSLRTPDPPPRLCLQGPPLRVDKYYVCNRSPIEGHLGVLSLGVLH